jgi:hypothetical protein
VYRAVGQGPAAEPDRQPQKGIYPMKDCPYHGPDCDGVVYGRPSNPMDAMWQTHRMGGCIMDLAMPAVRANAIRSGVIWSMPGGIEEALDDLWEGRVPYPDPATVPTEWLERLSNWRASRIEVDRAR